MRYGLTLIPFQNATWLRILGSEEDVRRLSPLVLEHINLAGRYHLVADDAILRGEYRPLKAAAQADALIA